MYPWQIYTNLNGMSPKWILHNKHYMCQLFTAFCFHRQHNRLTLVTKCGFVIILRLRILNRWIKYYLFFVNNKFVHGFHMISLIYSIKINITVLTYLKNIRQIFMLRYELSYINVCFKKLQLTLLKLKLLDDFNVLKYVIKY